MPPEPWENQPFLLIIKLYHLHYNFKSEESYYPFTCFEVKSYLEKQGNLALEYKMKQGKG